MYQFVFYLLAIILNREYFETIDQKNIYKSEFNDAYSSKNFKKAIEVFELIEKTSPYIEPELRINAAQAYFIVKDTSKAKVHYTYLKELSNTEQAALTDNQLGMLSALRGDTIKSLQYFQSSILKNPEVNQARFNYELIRKLYKDKVNLPPPPSYTPDQKEAVASIDRDELLKENKSEKISKEKALQLLDDLRNIEKVYLNKKKNIGQNPEKDW